MKKTNTKVNAAIIIIGNEILSGRTQDVNVVTISKWLNNLGIKLEEVRVIPDIENSIIKTVNEVRKKFNYIFTTGGIGPTHDDITSRSIAKSPARSTVPSWFNPDIIKRCSSSCSDMSSRTYSLSQFQEMIMGIQNRYKRVRRLEKVTFQSGLRIVADRGKQEVQIVHFFVL